MGARATHAHRCASRRDELERAIDACDFDRVQCVVRMSRRLAPASEAEAGPEPGQVSIAGGPGVVEHLYARRLTYISVLKKDVDMHVCNSLVALPERAAVGGWLFEWSVQHPGVPNALEARAIAAALKEAAASRSSTPLGAAPKRSSQRSRPPGKLSRGASQRGPTATVRHSDAGAEAEEPHHRALVARLPPPPENNALRRLVAGTVVANFNWFADAAAISVSYESRSGYTALIKASGRGNADAIDTCARRAAVGRASYTPLPPCAQDAQPRRRD